MSIIEKTRALREEAWQAVLQSPAYRAFKGLDDALSAMTGEGSAVVVVVNGLPKPRRVKSKPAGNGAVKRITQGDIAARVLKANGEPLPIGRWLEKSMADGINITGSDPLSNFRSTVSRDKRFTPFTRNNMFFWWFDGVELPEGWKEATDPDLPGLSAASDSDNQEGGDSHAATIAALTS